MAQQLLKTTIKSIEMLRAFENATLQLTLKELEERLCMGKVNTQRMAKTLLHEGMLSYNSDTRRYAISYGCLAASWDPTALSS